MKHILISIFAICTIFNGFSQTIEIEKAHLQKLFDQKDISARQTLTRKKALEKCDYPKLDFDTTTNKVSHSFTTSFPGRKKQDLFECVMQWTALTFNEKDATIKYQNPEEGKIITTAYTYLTFNDGIYSILGFPITNKSRLTCWYNIHFTIADESIEMEFVSIKYVFKVTTMDTNMGRQYTEEKYLINEFFPLTKYGVDEMEDYVHMINTTISLQEKQHSSLVKYAGTDQNAHEVKR
jgi:hypothetical protein